MLSIIGNILLIFILVGLGAFIYINFEDYMNDAIHQYIMFEFTKAAK